MKRTYRVTLMNWITRSKRNVELGESINEAKSKLKIVRKRYGRLMWIKTSPIFC